MSTEQHKGLIDRIPVISKLAQNRRERIQAEQQELENILKQIRDAGIHGSDEQVTKFVAAYLDVESYNFKPFAKALLELVGFNVQYLSEAEISKLANMWLFRHGID